MLDITGDVAIMKHMEIEPRCKLGTKVILRSL